MKNSLPYFKGCLPLSWSASQCLGASLSLPELVANLGPAYASLSVSTAGVAVWVAACMTVF